MIRKVREQLGNNGFGVVSVEHALVNTFRAKFFCNFICPYFNRGSTFFCICSGYLTARLIEQILTAECLAGYSEIQRVHIRRCALIDISRFALNVPAANQSINQYLTTLLENPPTERWIQVLNQLTSERELSTAYAEKSRSTIEIWANKITEKFSAAGVYEGVLFLENTESVIAELFPDLPYQSLYECPLIKIDEDSMNGQGESSEAYLLKTYCTTFDFQLQYPLAWHGALDPVAEIAFRTNLNSLGYRAKGVYCRIVENSTNSKVVWPRSSVKEHSVQIPPDSILVMLTIAEFQPTADGRRLWNYQGGGEAFAFPTASLDNILRALDWVDAVVVVETAGYETGASDRLAKLSAIKAPLYVIRDDCGTLASVVDPVRGMCSRGRVALVLTPNWSHFEGGGSRQLFLAWVVALDGSCTFVSILASDSAQGLKSWLKHGSPPETLMPFVFDDEQMRFDISSAARTWHFDQTDGVVIAPKNVDIVTSHILSFGW